MQAFTPFPFRIYRKERMTELYKMNHAHLFSYLEQLTGPKGRQQAGY
ncbi:hypothetical protein SCG7086_AN_00030 [Chlamydiales bacterium SCGC AG-110-P3]|nr:hypothetical protein SCG7086_AN_00030 [Chlamydiales bacterium SCGC AG-110-P3]